MVLVRLGSRGLGFRRRLLENRFLLTITQLRRGLHALLFRELRNHGFRGSGQLRHRLADRYSCGFGLKRWNGRPEPRQSFLSLLLPLRAAKTLGSRGEPASRFGKSAGLFMDLSKFKS